MSFNAKKIAGSSNGGGRKNYEPLEAGTYPARVVQLMVLGVQKQREFQGQEKPPVLELSVSYELLDEFLKDEDGNDLTDKPRWISETFPFHNLSQDKAKSTKRYLALDPNQDKDGDWLELLGTPCMVTVTTRENNGKTYENVAGISSMRPKEAAKAPDLVNEPRVFDFYHPTKEGFDALPQWIQDKLKDAVDYEGSPLQEVLEGKSQPKKVKTPKPPVQEELDDDTPFDGSQDDNEEDW